MKTFHTKKGFTSTPILVPFRFAKKTLLKTVVPVQNLTLVKNDSETKKQHQNWCRGFTLLEMTVSLGLFTIILFIATSAFLAVVNADRKSRSTRIALDNLNLTLEDMSRKIKTGSVYNCGGGASYADCAVAQNLFAFNDQAEVRTVYKIGSGSVGCGDASYGTNGCVLRSDDGGTSFMPVTSPEINISGLSFLVSGSLPSVSDAKQPTVMISIKGSIGTNTPINMQTTVTQRMYDS